VHSEDLRLGLLVLDASFNLTAANSEAVRVLTYPHDPPKIRGLEALLKKKLLAYFENSAPVMREFRSVNRTYRFRVVPLDALTTKGNKGAFALILERTTSSTLVRVEAVMEAATRFGLTAREQETVELLLRGFNSNEIAERMKISPHTVKTFVRLVMVKMGVATRSEIIAKILDTSSNGLRGVA
jgi:DNA-binding CsgD family transcriptional regulator